MGPSPATEKGRASSLSLGGKASHLTSGKERILQRSKPRSYKHGGSTAQGRRKHFPTPKCTAMRESLKLRTENMACISQESSS